MTTTTDGTALKNVVLEKKHIDKCAEKIVTSSLPPTSDDITSDTLPSTPPTTEVKQENQVRVRFGFC